jgi:hypothetical protein
VFLAGVWQAFDACGQAGPGAPPQQRVGGGRRGGASGGATTFKTDVPDHAADVILARPTARSITLSVLFYRDTRASVAYGVRPDAISAETETVAFKAGQPASVTLGQLQPDTLYVYELRSAGSSHGAATPVVSGSFRTARPPDGGPFVFTVTADSHLDERTDPAVYRRTLTTALADAPDFHVDLGDTFMAERHADRESAARQYLAQRFYFGLIARSAPLFLVLGNHDGEGTRRARGPDGLAEWANSMRTRHFPNPVPDGFYTGNASRDQAGGMLEDYYAWRWGAALFIVLDPFWYSNRRGNDDGWGWTLGTEQYEWLARTLERSEASFTFVFIHHLVGGADRQARGGAEASACFEWGGANADGSPGFSTLRRGWEMPIHDLLSKHRVTAVFHGHDHLYAHQERDAIVYQEVPQPGDAHGGSARSASEYGYRSGTVLGGTGYLRVRVGPTAAGVEYVGWRGQSGLPEILDRYALRPSAQLRRDTQ